MKIISLILEEISNELNISNTMYEKAVHSYGSVGSFIAGNCQVDEDTIKIYPQGSFSLGTVVRPIDDKDSGYDIDLVFQINDDKYSAIETKNIVGKPLIESDRYSKTLKEGKRCWTIQYQDFHMDILPSLRGKSDKLGEIEITHKYSGNQYQFQTSNPKGYKIWFDTINANAYNLARQTYAEIRSLKVDDVPEYKVRTSLQKSIQVLKRHRDVMFKDDKKAPISIIITTLAVKAYDSSMDLEEALINIIMTMENHIEYFNGKPAIFNPVNHKENFADKWLLDKERENNFSKWIKKLKKDFIYEPRNNIVGLDNLISHFEKILGEKAVLRAVESVGKNIENLSNQEKLYISEKTKQLTKADNSLQIKRHTFYGNKN